jgi:signal transduction histidine kinase
VAEAAVGLTAGVVLGALAAVLAGTLVGIARRQAVDRAAQEARTEVETLRAEVERERAELLSERNHLAREIHDVLAHTLAALSLQLEAFATVVESEPGTTTAVRDQLERTRQLVREGLEEASGAVRALRDDAPPLDGQLDRLCAQQQAAFSISGVPRPLPPQLVMTLFRAAQEALTNVMKHATGAPTSVCLTYGEDAVSVVVENRRSPGSPALEHTGNGFGLQGITERLALLGGRLEAGPTVAGWRMTATAPLPVTADPGAPA